MVDLIHILDDDGLTPYQERKIRRLVKYKLEREDDNIIFEYIINPKGEEPIECYDVFDINFLSKDIFYRSVLIELINFYAKINKDKKSIDQVLEIIRSHKIDLERSMQQKTFYLRIIGFHFELRDSRVKTKTLYRILEILIKQ